MVFRIFPQRLKIHEYLFESELTENLDRMLPYVIKIITYKPF